MDRTERIAELEKRLSKEDPDDEEWVRLHHEWKELSRIEAPETVRDYDCARGFLTNQRFDLEG